ncbi:MAG: hypothetical protein KKH52_01015, partial [Nanoarchaeota archaeon]|nr:hypothetical protein [Nanoarchaeota archaeon]
MGFSIYQEIFNNGSQRVCYNSFHGLRKENSSGTNNYSVNFEIYQEESGWVHLFLSFQEEDGQVC